ncbi:protein MpDIR10 [Marchantia polymorpha subsp. ruderalis]
MGGEEERKLFILDLSAAFFLLWIVLVDARVLEKGDTETLTFYVHGRNEAAIVASRGEETHDLSAMAAEGSFVFDNDVTEGSELTSKHLGRRQGVAIPDGSDVDKIYLVSTVVLEHHEKYRGALQVQGVESGDGDRGIPIVGGTGDFQGARGYAKTCLHTSEPNPVMKQSIVLYKCSFKYKHSVEKKNCNETSAATTAKDLEA